MADWKARRHVVKMVDVTPAEFTAYCEKTEAKPDLTTFLKFLTDKAFWAMLDLSTLALFAIAALALTASPGPDMLLIASRSTSQGRVSGFATLAGIQAGTYCHALAAALGLSQLFLLVPVAYDIVRYAGAAYLLWLAWKTFRSDGTLLAPTGGLRHFPLGIMFRQGLLTNL